MIQQVCELPGCGLTIRGFSPRQLRWQLKEHTKRCQDSTPKQRTNRVKWGQWGAPRPKLGPPRREGRPKLLDHLKRETVSLSISLELLKHLQAEAQGARVSVPDLMRAKLRQPLKRMWR